MAKILVIDDDADTRMLIEHLLQEEDHEVLLAEDGREGLALIEQQRPDLVILDVSLPHLDGIQMVRELRRLGLRQNTRIIFLSGKASELDFVKGWKLGADDYLTKPFDPEEVVLTVTATLMMTEEQIREKRVSELERSKLLSQIEATFGE